MAPSIKFASVIVCFTCYLGVARAQISGQRDTTIQFSSGHKYTLSVVTKFPALIGRVNDYEQIIDSSSIRMLTDLCSSHEEKTTDQIVIATVPNYEPDTALSDYAKHLANSWGIGQKNKNNGVLIILSKAKRNVWISVGLGLESRLTNERCQQIVNDLMIPRFKEGKFSVGLIDATNAVIQILDKG